MYLLFRALLIKLKLISAWNIYNVYFHFPPPLYLTTLDLRVVRLVLLLRLLLGISFNIFRVRYPQAVNTIASSIRIIVYLSTARNKYIIIC